MKSLSVPLLTICYCILPLAAEDSMQRHTDIPQMVGIPDRDDKGREFIRVESKVELLSLPPKLIQLVAAPDGKVLLGICKGRAAVLIFEPPSFKEVDEIPVPRFPVSIWCDNKRVMVASDEARSVTILDAEKRSPVISVRLKDFPDLIPKRITGVGPNDDVITIWGNDRNSPSGTHIFYISPNGEARLASECFGAEWCIPVVKGTQFVVQDLFAGSGTGNPCLVRSGKVESETFEENRLLGGKSGLARNFTHFFRTFDRRNCVIPTRSPDYSTNKWAQQRTYVVADDLSHSVFNFPGVAFAEVPKENILVSWGATSVDQNKFLVFYVNRTSGQIVRKVESLIDTDLVGNFNFFVPNATPLTTFVPGHELVVSMALDPYEHSKIIMIRCGPVRNAPRAVGISITNDPGLAARVGERYTFAPTFNTTAAKVVFKLKNALEGMSIDPANGTVSWTPSPAYLGKYDIQISADVDGQNVPLLTWTLEICK